MRNRLAAVAVAASLVLSACTGSEFVRNPITPDEARTDVVNAARDIVTILHADVAEATFSYESCNDQGDPPFRGKVRLLLWMPGVPHDQAADPTTVLHALTSHGWSTDSDFVSHSPTLRKDDINTIVTVAHLPRPGHSLGAHVIAEVDGACRDTFDHRTDRSILPIDIHGDVQAS